MPAGMPKHAEALLKESRVLAEACDALRFSDPVWTVYNAYGYAWAGYEAYIRKFVREKKRVLYLGMNPGPWGMAQTGVPFGEIDAVRHWMGLNSEVGKPEKEHPKRPIEGMQCKRSEVSGRRLWGLFAELYGRAEVFFREALVINYCPLSFMVESGGNLTPDKLPGNERKPLEAACDAHLESIIAILDPELVVGVGGFATKCLNRLSLGNRRIGTLLHPSPASPIANRSWPHKPIAQLREMGIIQ